MGRSRSELIIPQQQQQPGYSWDILSHRKKQRDLHNRNAQDHQRRQQQQIVCSRNTGIYFIRNKKVCICFDALCILSRRVVRVVSLLNSFLYSNYGRPPLTAKVELFLLLPTFTSTSLSFVDPPVAYRRDGNTHTHTHTHTLLSSVSCSCTGHFGCW